MKIVIYSTLIIILFLHTIDACTTAIISGKYTIDGRPLLWKQRDSGFEQNIIMYFDDGKYEYIGLVNAADTTGNAVWAGVNSEGFAIMNSQSYNLKAKSDTTEIEDQEGFVMKKALQMCSTVQEFAELLTVMQKPLGVEANFGVIDAQGDAAYFETNNFTFTKIDVNDPAVAPFGYLIRTNFSSTGRNVNNGYGYIRYDATQQLLNGAIAENGLSAQFLLQKGSRNLNHALTGVDLHKDIPLSEKDTRFVFFEDFVPRKSTVSAIVVQGVKNDESPSHSVMWTVLGWPLTSVAVPLWVMGGSEIPNQLLANDEQIAPLCNFSLQLKNKCFPVKRGSGNKYINLAVLLNQKNTGYMQLLQLYENEILREAQSKIDLWRKSGISNTEIQKYYKIMQSQLDTVIKLK